MFYYLCQFQPASDTSVSSTGSAKSKLCILQIKNAVQNHEMEGYIPSNGLNNADRLSLRYNASPLSTKLCYKWHI